MGCHLAREILAWTDGDIRVKDDTIIVTFYGAPNHINPKDYIGLPNILRDEGIDPRIPWLYGYKLDLQSKGYYSIGPQMQYLGILC